MDITNWRKSERNSYIWTRIWSWTIHTNWSRRKTL